ncbi:uncharacterized protein LOC108107798 [Drosophila eugracilis]|uniref:uncharacterized protein LOC108107798 n=1 Tax=Drosophila eugracilis TaxID=29029 RepID=UPI0007E61C8E|nr:uncharacterized protein LOC108107798 [Drosophila eugracilis]
MSDYSSNYYYSGNSRRAEKSVSYALYLHLRELGRPKRKLMRIASTKLQLTNELIQLQQLRQWETAFDLEFDPEASFQQRSFLDRNREYRDRLRSNMQRQLEKQQKRKRKFIQEIGKL